MDGDFAAKRDAAEKLIPAIEAAAEESEKTQHQSYKVVGALRQAGLYSMLLPRALGGGEMDFVDAMRIVERLAWADGSAGWCTMVAGVMAASAGSFLPDAGAKLIYGKGADVTLAGNGVPRGYARRVDGGYRIKATGPMAAASPMPNGFTPAASSSTRTASWRTTRTVRPRSC
jgi:alkylation response protein AidB-like acyl-CoA dehydrogenase